jgi:glycosyltransferase involved in cell wall biosynthesis
MNAATTAGSPPLSLAERLYGVLLRDVAVHLWPKRITAMLRVRDEEEYLDAAVRSIVDAVDEVLIVDNASTDATPQVIAALRAKYPAKVVADHYPHEIARVGRDTYRLLQRSDESPHLSGVFYTWCLRRCRERYVLKWDGDMIAHDTFAATLAAWRRSPVPVLRLRGANVHPDRRHRAASRSADRAALVARQEGANIPGWVTALDSDYPEPRLFPRAGARYDHRAGFTQTLASPFLDRRFGAAMSEQVPGDSYVHLKFCKRHPYANYSDDLARVIDDNLTAGPPLDEASARLLARWGIGAPAARRA